MNSLLYIFKFIFRIRWWLIICPIVLALVVYIFTKNLTHNYEVKTTIYTGVVSGYDISSNEGAKQDWNSINNAMDNIISIITAQTTLKNVSMRLYAQGLIEGNPKKDNNYITAQNAKTLYTNTPDIVMALVDKSSAQKTLENLYAFEQATRDNHVYGMFNWHHRHYSYEALSKIIVRRIGSSDMIEVKYVCDDPGIAFNTLKILTEEFVEQYKILRFGETNNVIKYFEEELERVGGRLRNSEDSLTNYNVEKRVINYDEQTKHIAALSRDFELRYETILLDYDGSKKLLESLETRINKHVQQLRDNTTFINKLASISRLTAEIATIESFANDSLSNQNDKIIKLRAELQKEESDFAQFSDILGADQYSTEGISSPTFVQEWLIQTLRFEKARAELKVMDYRKQLLNQQYEYYSPIGSTIKRKEREIDFTENTYLSILNSLSSARLRQKSLQMTSATLKVLNPPTFPISAMPTKRKLMVFGAFVAAIMFILGYFILLELFDRTLRDKLRAERIIGGQVLGAFPADNKSRNRGYNAIWQEYATKYISNNIFGYFVGEKPYIVNIISTETGDGKSILSNSLVEYWTNNGLNVKRITWKDDFDPESKQYILAKELDDLYEPMDEDVVIVEFPPLKQYSAPRELIHKATLNLLVTRANRVWKDTDQLMYDKIAEKSGDTPLMLYLTQAQEEVVENFTGLLPPYTFIRKLSYRIAQLGLTSQG